MAQRGVARRPNCLTARITSGGLSAPRGGEMTSETSERKGDREHDRDHEPRVDQRTLRLARRYPASAKSHMRRTQSATQGNVAIPMFKAYGKPTIAVRIDAGGTSYVHST